MAKQLSKSKYMAGLNCPRKLWLQLWQPELQREPVGMARLIRDQGVQFGELAHQLYPSARLIDVDRRHLAKAEEDTRCAIEAGAVLMLEATFGHGHYRVLCDVLERLSDGSWHLIEVKSSTRVKAEHIPDLAYQRRVMELCGYRVSQCSVLYANTRGKLPDIESLFTLEDVTEKVAAHLSLVAPSLRSLVPLLEDRSLCPPMAYQKACVGCDFQSHCWEGIDKPTIYQSIDSRKIAELEAMQVFYIEDIPGDFKLPAAARATVDRMQAQRTDINKLAIKGMLDKLEYPLYYLDFESAAIAMPLFEGSSPWQKYAFQYSLHIERENGDLEHIEFLHQDNSDPSRALAQSLVAHIGDVGSVIVYHKSMEGGVLKALASQFPDLAEPLRGMAKRIWDLEVVFKKHYRHWQWGTKSSIKKVLPTLVPQLSYSDLEIQEGGSATGQWIEMIRSMDDNHKAKIAEALLRYCELDTLAMVELLKVVRQELSQ